MKKLVLSFLVGGLLGLGAGFAAGIFVYPFWFLTDVATEEIANRDRKSTVASGAFLHPNPSDPIHWGKGHLTILKDSSGELLVHLEKDFEVGPGPRFHVYLVDRPTIRSTGDFRASGSVDLGRLRAFKGSQNYVIPAAVDLAKWQSVVIWCKEFGVLISPATLVRS